MEFTKQEAKRIYPDAPDWLKEKLEQEFGGEFFKPNDFEEIKTFNDACLKCGTTEEEFNARFALLGLAIDTVFYEKLKIVAKSINQEWVPDWNNTDQRKYRPYFKLSSGFGFSDSDYNYVNSITVVGSRLCFQSEEKCTYAANQFIDIYEQFLTI